MQLPAKRTKEKTVKTMMMLSQRKPQVDGIRVISPRVFLDGLGIIDGLTSDCWW